jgi:hypothetical protein
MSAGERYSVPACVEAAGHGVTATPTLHDQWMDKRYALATGIASTQFGAISIKQLAKLKIDAQVRYDWVQLGLIERSGPRSFFIVGSAESWERRVWGAAADVDGAGYVAGRSAARVQGLDGFDGDDGDEIEVLLQRKKRHRGAPHRVSSTGLYLGREHSIVVNGIRCLTAERLILDSPLFGFSRAETENAIDSAIRLRLVSEQRLRTRVVKRHRKSINGGRALLDALVDAGGESRLERWFLGIVRRAGLPHPELQKVWRDSSRTIARVDAFFPDFLIVELAGHATHSSRAARQADEQRRTELTLQGKRVITFTHEDVRDRPTWVADQLVIAVRGRRAA